MVYHAPGLTGAGTSERRWKRIRLRVSQIWCPERYRSMRNMSGTEIDERQRIEDVILSAIAEGTVLVGTLATLSQALGVKVAELRSVLRELLEARTIAVSTEAHGQLTIRLERRSADVRPRFPAVERRRATADVWIL